MEVAEQVHGFSSTLIIAGNVVNSDGGMAAVISTPGATNVRIIVFAKVEYSLRRQFFDTLLGIDEDTVLGQFKTHV